MGTQFSIVYDIIIAAVIVCMAFAGWKQGFAKVLLGFVTIIVAFAAAMLLSDPIASSVYKNYIEQPLEEQIEDVVDESFTSLDLGRFCNIDFDKIKINGVPASEVEPNYEGKASAVLDMTNLDFSESGLKKADLIAIGADISSDLSSVNANTAEFSRSDIEKYGVGMLAAAQYAAVNLTAKEEFSDFNSFAEIIDRFIPGEKKNTNTDTVTVSAVRTIVIRMIDSRSTLKSAVMDEIIAPNCLIALRTVVFTIIFILVSIIMGIIAKAGELINKIPVLGKANKFLGMIAGLCEGLVIIFVVCLITRFFVSLGGDSTILFNRSTIESTILFKKFYNMDFLNFLI